MSHRLYEIRRNRLISSILSMSLAGIGEFRIKLLLRLAGGARYGYRDERTIIKGTSSAGYINLLKYNTYLIQHVTRARTDFANLVITLSLLVVK